jgi:hypothetical protein
MPEFFTSYVADHPWLTGVVAVMTVGGLWELMRGQVAAVASATVTAAKNLTTPADGTKIGKALGRDALTKAERFGELLTIALEEEDEEQAVALVSAYFHRKKTITPTT